MKHINPISNLSKERVKFLIGGIWNTIFGYFFSVVIFKTFEEVFHTLLIAIFVNFVAISQSFFIYKKFVFCSEGNWLKEWLKSFVVYGFSGLISSILIWLMLDMFYLDIIYAQAYVIFIIVIFSYFGHKYYTFK